MSLLLDELLDVVGLLVSVFLLLVVCSLGVVGKDESFSTSSFEIVVS